MFKKIALSDYKIFLTMLKYYYEMFLQIKYFNIHKMAFKISTKWWNSLPLLHHQECFLVSEQRSGMATH